MARKSRRTRRLRVVNPDCAGIDIGKDRHFVAVDPERSDEPVRSFGSFTRDLEAMAAWLASCGVTKVAMESTSVYWIPVYETLERAGFEVMLVPPRMTKQIGGRKSDVLDCQWIWQLMSYGLLRGAFRPGDAVCPLRSYARQMRRLTGDRSRCVLHMQKALTEMNVRLDSVIANITGLTGQRILRAIIDGERDPERLATLRHRGIKADADTIAASLQGTWREEHLFALEQAMQRYDFLTQQIDDCEVRVMAEIERLTPPDDPPDGGAPEPRELIVAEDVEARHHVHEIPDVRDHRIPEHQRLAVLVFLQPLRDPLDRLAEAPVEIAHRIVQALLDLALDVAPDPVHVVGRELRHELLGVLDPGDAVADRELALERVLGGVVLDAEELPQIEPRLVDVVVVVLDEAGALAHHAFAEPVHQRGVVVVVGDGEQPATVASAPAAASAPAGATRAGAGSSAPAASAPPAGGR